jgi:hypothetical protein
LLPRSDAISVDDRMRRGGRASTRVPVLVIALALLTSPYADAGPLRPRCPFVVVNRQEGRELSARLCHTGAVVDWLGATPSTPVESQPPPGELGDGFTVSIFSRSRRLLSARVYLFADAGPIAYVPSRTVLRTNDPVRRRWIVPVGWRTIDATEHVPAVLRRLGMSLPAERSSPVTDDEASPPAPDLVTLGFVLAAFVAVAFAWRNLARHRRRPDAWDR